MKIWPCVLAGVFGAIVVPYVFKSTSSASAMHCINVSDDRNWSFRSFENKCDRAITARFCDKSGVGEVARIFGFQNVGDWRCKTGTYYPGENIATIKWTNEQSSVASIALASSVYTIIACFQTHNPIPAGEGKFHCELSK